MLKRPKRLKGRRLKTLGAAYLSTLSLLVSAVVPPLAAQAAETPECNQILETMDDLHLSEEDIMIETGEFYDLTVEPVEAAKPLGWEIDNVEFSEPDLVVERDEMPEEDDEAAEKTAEKATTNTSEANKGTSKKTKDTQKSKASQASGDAEGAEDGELHIFLEGLKVGSLEVKVELHNPILEKNGYDSKLSLICAAKTVPEGYKAKLRDNLQASLKNLGFQHGNFGNNPRVSSGNPSGQAIKNPPSQTAQNPSGSSSIEKPKDEQNNAQGGDQGNNNSNNSDNQGSSGSDDSDDSDSSGDLDDDKNSSDNNQGGSDDSSQSGGDDGKKDDGQGDNQGTGSGNEGSESGSEGDNTGSEGEGNEGSGGDQGDGNLDKDPDQGENPNPKNPDNPGGSEGEGGEVEKPDPENPGGETGDGSEGEGNEGENPENPDPGETVDPDDPEKPEPTPELKKFDVSGWHFDEGQLSFVYDGQEHAPVLLGVPEEVKVTYTASETNAGTYTYTASFEVPEGYEEVPDMAVDYEITPLTPEVSYTVNPLTGQLETTLSGVLTEDLEGDIKTSVIDATDANVDILASGLNPGYYNIKTQMNIVDGKKGNYTVPEIDREEYINVQKEDSFVRFGLDYEEKDGLLVVTVSIKDLKIPRVGADDNLLIKYHLGFDTDRLEFDKHYNGDWHTDMLSGTFREDGIFDAKIAGDLASGDSIIARMTFTYKDENDKSNLIFSLGSVGDEGIISYYIAPDSDYSNVAYRDLSFQGGGNIVMVANQTGDIKVTNQTVKNDMIDDALYSGEESGKTGALEFIKEFIESGFQTPEPDTGGMGGDSSEGGGNEGENPENPDPSETTDPENPGETVDPENPDGSSDDKGDSENNGQGEGSEGEGSGSGSEGEGSGGDQGGDDLNKDPDQGSGDKTESGSESGSGTGSESGSEGGSTGSGSGGILNDGEEAEIEDDDADIDLTSLSASESVSVSNTGSSEPTASATTISATDSGATATTSMTAAPAATSSAETTVTAAPSSAAVQVSVPVVTSADTSASDSAAQAQSSVYADAT